MYTARNNNHLSLPPSSMVTTTAASCKFTTIDDGGVYSVGKRRKAKSTLNTNSPGFMTATTTAGGGDANTIFFPDVGTTATICSLNLPEIPKSSTASSNSNAATAVVSRNSGTMMMGATSREPPDNEIDMEEAEDSDLEGYTLISSPPATNIPAMQNINAIRQPSIPLYAGREADGGASVLNVRYVAGFSASNVYDMTATGSDAKFAGRSSTTCRLLNPNGGVEVEADDCHMTMYDAKIVNGRLEAPALRYGGVAANHHLRTGGGSESVSRTSSTSNSRSVDREEADDDDYDEKSETKPRPFSTTTAGKQQRRTDMSNFIGRNAVLHNKQQQQQPPTNGKVLRSPARNHAGKSSLQKPAARQQQQQRSAWTTTTATQTSATPSTAGTPRSSSSARRKGKPSPIRDIPTVPDAAGMSADGVLMSPGKQHLTSIQGRISDVLSLDHNTISRSSKSPDRRGGATTREPADDDDFVAAISSSGRRMRPSRKAAPKSFAHWTEYFSSNRDTDGDEDDEGGDEAGDAHARRRQRSSFYADDEERAVEITTSMLRDLQADDEEEEYQQPQKGFDEDDSADEDDGIASPKYEEADDAEYNFGSAAPRRRPTTNAQQVKGGASSSRRGVKRKRTRPQKIAKADMFEAGSDESEMRESYKEYKKKIDAYEVDQLLYHSKDGDLKRNFACPDCGKSYTTPSNLTRHRQVHRNPDDDNSARQCPKCGKKYLSIPAFAMHMLSHKKSYSCRMCPKSFSRQWLLHCHERTHTGEKPYVCPVKSCSRSFADHSNYRAHVQTHNESKTFACQVCNKSFNLKSYLTKHQKGSGHRNKRRVLVANNHRSVVDEYVDMMQYEDGDKEFKQEEEVDSGRVGTLVGGSGGASEPKTPTKKRPAGRQTSTPTKKRTTPKKIISRNNSNRHLTPNNEIVKNGDALLLLAAAMHVERSSSSSFADVLAEARTPPLSPRKNNIMAEARTPPMSPPKHKTAPEPRTPPMSPPKKLVVVVGDAGTPPMSPPKKPVNDHRRSNGRGESRSSSSTARATPTTPPFSPRLSMKQIDNVMDVQMMMPTSPKTPPSVAADVMPEGVEADMPRISSV